MLPILKGRNVKSREIFGFGGYGIGKNGAGGLLTENILPDAQNRLTVRPVRYTVKKQASDEPDLNGIGAGKALFWMQGNNFYYDGAPKGAGADGVSGERVYAVMNDKVLILPDKLCYDSASDTLVPIENTVDCSLDGASFTAGTLGGADAGVNTVSKANMIWETYGVRVGDGITVSYRSPSNTTVFTRNATVCEIGAGYIGCQKNAFAGLENMTVVGIGRYMPELDFVFECGNRVWGCKGFNIYCSAPGDMFNWNSTQAWSCTVGNGREFTGAAAYNGTPTFFTGDSVVRVYGTKPEDFGISVSSPVCGIAPGSSGSAAVAGGKLLYLSENGVMSYSGGIPERISAPLGDMPISNGTAVSDGRRYYLRAENADGGCLYVFDTENGVWTRENAPDMSSAVCFGNVIYACGSRGIVTLGSVSAPDSGWIAEEEIQSSAVFGEDFFGTLSGKQPISIRLSVACGSGASLSAYLSFDGGEFVSADRVWSRAAGPCGIDGDTEYTVSIPLRYCTRLSLKLIGEGSFTVRGLGIRYREI